MDKQEKFHLWGTAVVGLVGAVIGGLIGASAAVNTTVEQLEHAQRAEVMDRRANAYAEYVSALSAYAGARRSYHNVYPSEYSQLQNSAYMEAFTVPAQSELSTQEGEIVRTTFQVDVYGSPDAIAAANEVFERIAVVNKTQPRGENGGRYPLSDKEILELESFIYGTIDEFSNFAKKEIIE